MAGSLSRTKSRRGAGARDKAVNGGLAQQARDPVAQSQRQDNEVDALALAVRAGPRELVRVVRKGG
eukprot:1350625-Lingulodinium_polyedra.AAC.1